MRIGRIIPDHVKSEDIFISKPCPCKISEICERIVDRIFIAGVGGGCGAMIGFVVNKIIKNPENINDSSFGGIGIYALTGSIFTIALHQLIIMKCEEIAYRRWSTGSLSFPADDSI